MQLQRAQHLSSYMDILCNTSVYTHKLQRPDLPRLEIMTCNVDS